ncbi:MAG: tRNA (N(6)-L-threonylcarbamoyladenosine(37)-C(2))-methylthiotransferase MtaB [Bacteroidales bacterium]|nr:tRNA (N(6)-L-threonylcarbamoyladenosine(37)-C(2))-methylthiotransferase MtaB [Bacteroidales bacterium]
MTKIALMTLGCKLNYAETSTYERGFRSAGLEVVPYKQSADLYLINTCSVTATADQKSRNLIRRVHRTNPDAKIVVTGCSAELRRAEIEKIEGVWKVFGCREKARIVPDCLAGLGFPAETVTADAVFGAYSSGERTRSFLKVQDGCDNYCNYCTVPYARGASRNLPICECVRMAREIAAQGVKEIVLTGVNTGDYGKTTGESFLSLLQALNEVDGIERYRISSIEPNLLSSEIIDWIASGTKFQPHFHIPLQTGSDQLLASMGRHYTTAFFAGKLAYIRRVLGSGVFFGIDVMVGLPGETPELFEDTVAFLRQIRPAFIHVFPYSRRPGTPAADMPGQVDEEEKKRRVAVLEELCLQLHSEFVSSQKGTTVSVLFESKEKDGTMGGYSGNYIRVTRPYDPALSGKIVEVTL